MATTSTVSLLSAQVAPFFARVRRPPPFDLMALSPPASPSRIQPHCHISERDNTEYENSVLPETSPLHTYVSADESINDATTPRSEVSTNLTDCEGDDSFLSACFSTSSCDIFEDDHLEKEMERDISMLMEVFVDTSNIPGNDGKGEDESMLKEWGKYQEEKKHVQYEKQGERKEGKEGQGGQEEEKQKGRIQEQKMQDEEKPEKKQEENNERGEVKHEENMHKEDQKDEQSKKEKPSLDSAVADKGIVIKEDLLEYDDCEKEETHKRSEITESDKTKKKVKKEHAESIQNDEKIKTDETVGNDETLKKKKNLTIIEEPLGVLPIALSTSTLEKLSLQPTAHAPSPPVPSETPTSILRFTSHLDFSTRLVLIPADDAQGVGARIASFPELTAVEGRHIVSVNGNDVMAMDFGQVLGLCRQGKLLIVLVDEDEIMKDTKKKELKRETNTAAAVGSGGGMQASVRSLMETHMGTNVSNVWQRVGKGLRENNVSVVSVSDAMQRPRGWRWGSSHTGGESKNQGEKESNERKTTPVPNAYVEEMDDAIFEGRQIASKEFKIKENEHDEKPKKRNGSLEVEVYQKHVGGGKSKLETNLKENKLNKEKLTNERELKEKSSRKDEEIRIRNRNTREESFQDKPTKGGATCNKPMEEEFTQEVVKGSHGKEECIESKRGVFKNQELTIEEPTSGKWRTKGFMKDDSATDQSTTDKPSIDESTKDENTIDKSSKNGFGIDKFTEDESTKEELTKKESTEKKPIEEELAEKAFIKGVFTKEEPRKEKSNKNETHTIERIPKEEIRREKIKILLNEEPKNIISREELESDNIANYEHGRTNTTIQEDQESLPYVQDRVEKINQFEHSYNNTFPPSDGSGAGPSNEEKKRDEPLLCRLPSDETTPSHTTVDDCTDAPPSLSPLTNTATIKNSKEEESNTNDKKTEHKSPASKKHKADQLRVTATGAAQAMFGHLRAGTGNNNSTEPMVKKSESMEDEGNSKPTSQVSVSTSSTFLGAASKSAQIFLGKLTQGHGGDNDENDASTTDAKKEERHQSGTTIVTGQKHVSSSLDAHSTSPSALVSTIQGDCWAKSKQTLLTHQAVSSISSNSHTKGSPKNQRLRRHTISSNHSLPSKHPLANLFVRTGVGYCPVDLKYPSVSSPRSGPATSLPAVPVTNNSILEVRLTQDISLPMGSVVQWYISVSSSGSSSSSFQRKKWRILQHATQFSFQPSAVHVGRKLKCIVTLPPKMLENMDKMRSKLPKNFPDIEHHLGQTQNCEMNSVVSADPALFSAALHGFSSGAGLFTYGRMMGRGNANGRAFRIILERMGWGSNSTSLLSLVEVFAKGKEAPWIERVEGVQASLADASHPRHFELVFQKEHEVPTSVLTDNYGLELEAPQRMTRETFLLGLGVANSNLNRNQEEGAMINCFSDLFPDKEDEEEDYVIKNGVDGSNDELNRKESIVLSGGTEGDFKVEKEVVTNVISSTYGASKITNNLSKKSCNEIEESAALKQEFTVKMQHLEKSFLQQQQLNAVKDAEVVNLKKALEASEKKWRQSVESHIGTQDELVKCSRMLRLTEKRIDTFESTIVRLKNDHSERLMTMDNKISTQQSQISKQQKVIKSLQNEKAVLYAKVEVKDSKLIDHVEKIKFWGKETANQKEKILGLDGTIAHLRKEMEKKDLDLKGFMQLKEDAVVMNKTIVELKEDKSIGLKAQQELDVLMGKHVELTETYQKQENEISQLNSLFQEGEEKIKTLQSTVTTYDTIISRLKQHNHNLQIQRNNLRCKSDSLSKEIGRICRNGKSIQEIEQILREHDILKSELSRLRSDHKTLQAELNKLTAAHDDVLSASTRAGIDGDTIIALQRTAELERVVTDLTEYVGAKDMQLETLKEINRTLTEEGRLLREHGGHAVVGLGNNDI